MRISEPPLPLRLSGCGLCPQTPPPTTCARPQAGLGGWRAVVVVYVLCYDKEGRLRQHGGPNVQRPSTGPLLCSAAEYWPSVRSYRPGNRARAGQRAGSGGACVSPRLPLREGTDPLCRGPNAQLGPSMQRGLGSSACVRVLGLPSTGGRTNNCEFLVGLTPTISHWSSQAHSWASLVGGASQSPPGVKGDCYT